MEINYLILAHTNFNILDKIIKELDGKNVKFYVHIDKKTKNNYKNSSRNVTILNRRFIVNWGCYGVIKATLELMRIALKNTENEKSRFVLLSGADFPIRSNEFIRKRLNNELEYINLLPAPLPHKPMKRFTYFFFDIDRRNSKKPISFIGRAVEMMLQKIRIKRMPPKFKIFVGSQWFALTGSCLAYILEEVESNKDYEKFFKNTLIPDESFFQTIIGNSIYKSRVRNNLTFTDWSPNGGPNLINKSHLVSFKEQFVFNGVYGEYIPLFARKFDQSNYHLFDTIKKMLR